MTTAMLTLRPHEAKLLARAALAAVGSDIPVLEAAHFRIRDRFDEGETGYLVNVTTTDRTSLHHVTFATSYTTANGPAEFTLNADTLTWIRDNAFAYGHDAQVTISALADEYTVTILKGVRGTERMTRRGTPPAGTFPDLTPLLTTARTAAAAPIELHRYRIHPMRGALAVLGTLNDAASTVTFKQTVPSKGRAIGPLLITVDSGRGDNWEILIQPAELITPERSQEAV